MNLISHSGFDFRKKDNQAFSLLEALLVVAIIGILSSIAVISTGGINESAKLSKLESDVSSINSAIKIYLINGGDLSGVSDPQSVIDKLKTRRTDSSAERFAGLRSSMVDKRLAVVMQSPGESTTTRARAIWNSTSSRFVVTNSGANGVSYFSLDDAMAAADYGTENREASPIDLNPNDGWVWTYSDSTPLDSPSPTSITITDPGAASSSSGSGSTGSGSSGSGTGSSGSGSGSGSGSSGSGSGSGSGGSGSGGTSDGGGSGGDPEPPLPSRLRRPNFTPGNTYHSASSFPLYVSISNPNSSAVSYLEYRVGSGSWQAYSGSPIEILPNQRLQAKAKTLDPTSWRDSSTRSRTFRPLVENFEGIADTYWYNPIGGPNLVYQITTPGNGSSSIVHGNTTIVVNGVEQRVGTENSLGFEPSNFGGVSVGQTFQMGMLSYYNGSTFNQSDASEVTLRLDLSFNEPAMTATIDIPFELVSSPNSDDPFASADSVVFADQTFNLPTVNGVRYELQLEFGTISNGGFGTSSTLSAFEGEQANVQVNARLRVR
ncbi:MAG: choice-of-anchor K domain-containing protein [Verrucomicrobiota bacterium]